MPNSQKLLRWKELRSLGQLVSGYLDFAERQAEREQTMTMKDWQNILTESLQCRVNSYLSAQARFHIPKRWIKWPKNIKVSTENIERSRERLFRNHQANRKQSRKPLNKTDECELHFTLVCLHIWNIKIENSSKTADALFYIGDVLFYKNQPEKHSFQRFYAFGGQIGCF